MLSCVKVTDVEDVVDDPTTAFVPYESLKDNVKEDEYEDCWMWKTYEEEVMEDAEVDVPSTLVVTPESVKDTSREDECEVS